MRFALPLILLLGRPAAAATELSLPCAYQSLVFATGDQVRSAQGICVPLLWSTASGKRLQLESSLGYTLLRNPTGTQGNYASFENSLMFSLPLGFLTTSFGGHASVLTPITALPELSGTGYSVGPAAGISIDTGLCVLEGVVSTGPTWGFATQGGESYRTDLTRVEGRVTFGF